MNFWKSIEDIIEVLHGVNVWSGGFRVLLALLLGGLVGLERGRHGRAAGLRTHILVCVGSTVAALVGLYSCQVPFPDKFRIQNLKRLFVILCTGDGCNCHYGKHCDYISKSFHTLSVL